MPRRSLTLSLIGINLSLWSAGFILSNLSGQAQQSRFMSQNFCLSRINFAQGRYYTWVTSHLTDQSPLDVVLNSAFFYYFGLEFERKYGNYKMFKLILLSWLVGSLMITSTILGTSPTGYGQEMFYQGTYAYVRAVIYYFIIQNPYIDIQLFPKMPKIPLFMFGAVVLIADILKFGQGAQSGFLTALISGLYL